MKFIISFLLLSYSCLAAQVTLTWDPNIEPELSGYAIFDRNYQKSYNYTFPLWEGTEITCTVTVPNDRQSAFVARAFAYGPYDLNGDRLKIWSDNSNEVIFTPSIVKPQPPKNLIIRIFQAIGRFFKSIFSGLA